MGSFGIMLSLAFIAKWLFALGLLALVGTLVWSGRCVLLGHRHSFTRVNSELLPGRQMWVAKCTRGGCGHVYEPDCVLYADPTL